MATIKPDRSSSSEMRRGSAGTSNPDLVGAALVPVVSGFAVGIWDIIGVTRVSSGYVAFEIDTATVERMVTPHTHRLPFGRGPVSKLLP
jgi:hypothetical protein